MSKRQERIARKRAQADGTAAFVHVKPTVRVLGPLRIVPNENGTGVHFSNRQAERRRRLYERDTTGQREVQTA
jgi:hypothetical protein